MREREREGKTKRGQKRSGKEQKERIVETGKWKNRERRREKTDEHTDIQAKRQTNRQIDT